MDRPNTSIQNHLQLMIQFVAAVMMLVSCCLSATAQGNFPRNAYTIIGDVAIPGTYYSHANQRMPLQLLLQQARFVGPSGTAIIRKGNQPEQVTPVSVLTNLENPIFLNPGDTIVWRSNQRTHLQRGNVALLTDRGPQLQTIPVTGINLAALKQQAHLRVHQPVVAHRYDLDSQQSFRRNPDSGGVMHGDVLDIRTSVAHETAVPMIVTQTPDQPSSDIVKTVSRPIQDSTGPPLHTLPPAPQFQQQSGSAIITMPAPLPSVGNALQIPDVPLQQTNNFGFPVDLSSINEDISEGISSSNLSDSSSSNNLALANATEDQAAHVTPHPINTDEEDNTQAILSGIFMFGLLLAIGLITIGIVRTRQEQRFHDQMRAGTIAHPTVVQTATASAELLATPNDAEQAENEDADIQQMAIDTADTTDVETADVETTNTIGSPTCSQESMSKESMSKEFMSKEFMSQESSSEDLILELPDIDSMRHALATTNDDFATTDFATQSVSQQDIDPLFADQTQHSEVDAVDFPQTIQDQEDIMAHPPTTQAETQYLEDLIQNRLPMELSEAQLPLKIALFGKPEGPRRLRIDAAHSTIAPPHMASAATRSKRREPAMAMKNDAGKQAAKQDQTAIQPSSSDPSEQIPASQPEANLTTQNSDTSGSVVTSPQSQIASQSSTSGLDKALNFLEEQSKS